MPRLRLVPSAAALVLIAVVGLGACASDEDITKAQFTEGLLERAGEERDDQGDVRTEGITEDEAACLTDGIFEAFDQSDVNRIYHAATEAEVGGDDLEVLDGINDDCIASDEAAPSDEGSSDEDPAEGTTTTEG